MYAHCLMLIHVDRGAEAGGILGVNTPHFFGLTPTSFGGPQKWKLEREGNKKVRGD